MDIEAKIKITPGSDCIEINGYVIHEVCNKEFAVYTLKQINLPLDEQFDFPSFKYACNAISYCLGKVTETILNEEEDLKLYLERNK
jgi:hypothetical protein